MRAAVLIEPGAPLELQDLQTPRPGPGEVLVRVEACGVCHSDLHLADGDWGTSLARRIRPTILGHELVGRVELCGSGVTTLAPGDRIGVGWVGASCGRCQYCAEGNDNLCEARRITGIDLPGGYSTHALVKADQAVAIPEQLASVQAAPLLCAGVTVFRGMAKADIRPGHRVAVFGVGGLGHLAVQLACDAGAETTAVDLEEAKLSLALDLGATEALGAADAESAITARGGAHTAVVTAASSAAYDSALASLRRGGAIVVLGLPSEPLAWLADDLATAEARVFGSAVGSRADQSAMLGLAAAGRLRCVVETSSLDDVNLVLDRLRRGDVVGRLVLEMEPTGG